MNATSTIDPDRNINVATLRTVLLAKLKERDAVAWKQEGALLTWTGDGGRQFSLCFQGSTASVEVCAGNGRFTRKYIAGIHKHERLGDKLLGLVEDVLKTRDLWLIEARKAERRSEEDAKRREAYIVLTAQTVAELEKVLPGFFPEQPRGPLDRHFTIGWLSVRVSGAEVEIYTQQDCKSVGEFIERMAALRNALTSLRALGG